MVEGVEFLSAAEDTFDIVNIPKYFGTSFGRGWRPELRVSGSLGRELVVDKTLETVVELRDEAINRKAVINQGQLTTLFYGFPFVENPPLLLIVIMLTT